MCQSFIRLVSQIGKYVKIIVPMRLKLRSYIHYFDKRVDFQSPHGLEM